MEARLNQTQSDINYIKLKAFNDFRKHSFFHFLFELELEKLSKKHRMQH